MENIKGNQNLLLFLTQGKLYNIAKDFVEIQK